jgi:dihydrodipicolinate synthase/N-acetylneuraminate lyase
MRLPGGVYCAMITPMAAAEVASAEVERLVRAFRSNNLAGVLVAGTTGEGPLLTPAQYRTVIEVAAAAASDELVVLAGASDTSSVRTLALLEIAARAGAHVGLVLLPYYFHTGNVDTVAYFALLARESPLPLVIYNFLRLTGQAVSPREIAMLASEDRIIGVKDSSGALAPFSRVIAATAAADFVALQGLATLAHVSLCAGADGFFSATANVVPALDAALYRAFVDGDLARCRDLQRLQADLAAAIGWFGAPVGVGVKRALAAVGRGNGDMWYHAAQPEGDPAGEFRVVLARAERAVGEDHS